MSVSTDSPQRRDRAARERTVSLDGMDILVREVGEGLPILLVNGLGAHTAMWDSLERALVGFHVISYDGPGAGRSVTPRCPVSVERLARLATLVLDECGVRQADALGYSMGGMVLQQLCADHPERVRRAVFAATSPGLGAVHGDAKALLNIATPARYLSPRLYNLTIGSLAGGRARHDREWVAQQGMLRLRHAPSIRGYLTQLMSVSRWSGMALHERIEHPALVICGDDDPLLPVANAMILAHRIPRARLHVIRGDGHLLLMDDESVALRMIRQFVAAADVEDAAVYQEASEVSAEELELALSGAGGFQAQPWGLVSSLVRRRYMR